MNFSIIIPFYNEEDNVTPVLEETRRTNPQAEIVAVNDGSTDATEARIRAIPDVRLVSFPRNLGQSAALYAGLLEASNEVLVLMDGDGQNDPADIPRLLSHLAAYDVVCGYRRRRHESWQVKIASRIANRVRRFVTDDDIRDAGCTLKVIRRQHLAHLIPFREMQCYMAAMLRRAGLRIFQVPVNHRPRRAGRSNYTIARRAWGGVWDLLGVYWLLRRRIAWPADFPTVAPQLGSGASRPVAAGNGADQGPRRAPPETHRR